MTPWKRMSYENVRHSLSVSHTPTLGIFVVHCSGLCTLPHLLRLLREPRCQYSHGSVEQPAGLLRAQPSTTILT